MVLADSILIHKIPVAFTLGFTFSQSGASLSELSTKIVVFMFVISSPLGLVVGALISENVYDYSLMVIQAISAGTFVYLAACDLLHHEFNESQISMTTWVKITKIGAVLLGWVFVIFLITVLPTHED